MRLKKTGLLALAALALAGCERHQLPTEGPPSPPSSPDPLPTATPHPAKAASSRAMQLYPDLAKADSMFNRAFLEIYADRLKRDPNSLTKVDWPLEVAREAATMLDTTAAAAVTHPAEPVPTAAAGSAATPRPLGNSLGAPPGVPGSSALDSRAYGRKEAFIDTDGDGKKFDLRQPSRVRR